MRSFLSTSPSSCLLALFLTTTGTHKRAAAASAASATFTTASTTRCAFLGTSSLNHHHPRRSAAISSSSSTLVRNNRMSSSSSSNKQIVVDPFCFRQFSEHVEASQAYKGTVFTDLTVSQMEDLVNRHYNADPSLLQDGYAPFCKHLFVKNDGFTQSARSNILEITPDNQHLLRTEYQARNDKELPVLARYFPAELLHDQKVELPVATYLDVILYSRDQINQENASRKNGGDDDEEERHETAPWGIVSIKAQSVDYELPMTPITAMRNALGKEEGGSGVPLNRDEYMKAVNYWKNHAPVA